MTRMAASAIFGRGFSPLRCWVYVHDPSNPVYLWPRHLERIDSRAKGVHAKKDHNEMLAQMKSGSVISTRLRLQGTLDRIVPINIPSVITNQRNPTTTSSTKYSASDDAELPALPAARPPALLPNRTGRSRLTRHLPLPPDDS